MIRLPTFAAFGPGAALPARAARPGHFARWACLAACLPLAFAALPAAAQDYPNKPIRLVVPYPPGGGNDTLRRLVAQRLSTALGQQVFVESKAGAGGNLGTELVARAKPDGYTLTLGFVANMAMTPHLSKVNYDALKDFAPISMVAQGYQVLVVKSAVLEANPWVAMNFYKAFLEAKNRSMARLSDITASHAPLAWMADYTTRLRSLFGDDFYPYGIGPGRGGEINRATLEAFLKFGFEQGVCQRQLAVEELFPKEVLASYRV
jgi:hypothetical protein